MHVHHARGIQTSQVVPVMYPCCVCSTSSLTGQEDLMLPPPLPPLSQLWAYAITIPVFTLNAWLAEPITSQPSGPSVNTGQASQHFPCTGYPHGSYVLQPLCHALPCKSYGQAEASHILRSLFACPGRGRWQQRSWSSSQPAGPGQFPHLHHCIACLGPDVICSLAHSVFHSPHILHY